MPYRAHHLPSIAFALLALGVSAAHGAQTQQSEPASFCPRSAGTGAAADATSPNFNAGMAAFRNKKYPLAYSHLRPLAQSGNVEAERGLGLLLMQSCGPNGDKSLAASWIGKAAGAGDIPASAALGRMYMNGEGVKQDDSTAFKWLMQAANGEDAPSQVSLGVL
jgi:TPR repeat protein